MFNIIHLARPIARLAGAASILLALTGCGAIVSDAPTPQLRVVTASPDAPRIDVYQGPNVLAHNLGFGTVTSYIPLSPGMDTIAANTAGTRQLLSAAKTSFASSGQYTVLIGSNAATLQQLILTDQSQPAPAGQTALRFLNQATHSGPIDIYLVPAGQRLTAVAPTVTNTLFGANTGYLNLPAGAYSLVMMPSGTVPPAPSLAIYTGSQVTYPSGSARTIILIDPQQATAPGLQVITASDFDPPAN